MTCRKVLYLSPSQKGGGVVLYMNLLFRFFKMFSSHFYPSTLLVLYIIGAYTSLSLIHIYFIVPLVSLSISPPPLPCHMCCLSRLTAFQSLLGAWHEYLTMGRNCTSRLLTGSTDIFMYIDAHIISQQDYDSEDISFLKSAILDQWDVNNDGKINKQELTMLLLHQVFMQLIFPSQEHLQY